MWNGCENNRFFDYKIGKVQFKFLWLSISTYGHDAVAVYDVVDDAVAGDAIWCLKKSLVLFDYSLTLAHFNRFTYLLLLLLMMLLLLMLLMVSLNLMFHFTKKKKYFQITQESLHQLIKLVQFNSFDAYFEPNFGQPAVWPRWFAHLWHQYHPGYEYACDDSTMLNVKTLARKHRTWSWYLKWCWLSVCWPLGCVHYCPL